VKDTGSTSAKELSGALHSLKVNNELYIYKIQDLRQSLTTKQMDGKKGKLLGLQQRKEFQSGAVLWTLRKVREAEAQESAREAEEEAENLRKIETKELKAAALLFRKQMAAAAKVACEKAKEVKKKERNDKAAWLAAARIEKQHHREAENAQKALQLSQRGKRTAS
jgi:cell division septum initiation protein DivIVA